LPVAYQFMRSKSGMILLRKISQAAKSRIMNDFQRTDRDFAKLGSKLGCASHGEVFILRFIEKMFFFKRVRSSKIILGRDF
jgi:hypothetical protein